MKIQRIREIARHQGLEPGKAEKAGLIGAIQRKDDCFAAAGSSKHS
jgi:hypothetical protein